MWSSLWLVPLSRRVLPAFDGVWRAFLVLGFLLAPGLVREQVRMIGLSVLFFWYGLGAVKTCMTMVS